MSYISLIVPAFHLNTGNINEIKNYCSSHFDVSEDLIKVIELTGPTLKNNYGIIFEKSILNLNKIQELIYEKNCLKSFNEKIYESFRLLDQKINDLKQCINDFNMNKKEEKYINEQTIECFNKNNKTLDFDIFYVNAKETFEKIQIDFDNILRDLNFNKNNTNITEKNNNLLEQKTFIMVEDNEDYTRKRKISINNNEDNNIYV